MNPTLLYNTAIREMQMFLPDEINNYVIGIETHRIRRHGVSDNINVLISAMPRQMAENLNNAMKMAGFNPTRIDVRENTRGLMLSRLAKGYVPMSSFAILDLSRTQINITLYVDGLFYSNRYIDPTTGADSGESILYDDEKLEKFLATIRDTVKSAPRDDANSISQSIGSGDSNSFMQALVNASSELLSGKHDAGALTEEIISIIHYIGYQERGSEIQRIYVIGDDNIPGLKEALLATVDIPMLGPNEWLHGRQTKKIINH
jgi:hypothetical protein